jgi:DNA invertase Pin-like site-specific DNA recombinase
MFQVIGAMSEFERSLIQARVWVDMSNARAKIRHIGRQGAVVDEARIGQLSALGTPWTRIWRTVGVREPGQ